MRTIETIDLTTGIEGKKTYYKLYVIDNKNHMYYFPDFYLTEEKVLDEIMRLDSREDNDIVRYKIFKDFIYLNNYKEK